MLSLVAAYSFNEGTGTTVADASGTGNVGTATNTTWSTSGKNAGALSFNGTSSIVNIPDSASLHLSTGMTLEAWVRPTTVTSAWRDVIYKGDDIYFLEATSTTSSRPAGGVKVGTSNLETVGAAALTVNTWTHLALTYDGANLRLYVNGAQVSTAARSGTIASSTNALQIGADSLYGQRFAGLIDDVRIYNTALTAAQIQTDMNTPVGAAADTQAPTAPASLTATAASTSQINLTWPAATDNVAVTGYQVERQNPGSTTFTQIATPTGTTYSDTGLSAGATYTYRVRAVDAAGNLGAFSPVASATTQTAPDTTPPSAPASLTATSASYSQINLSWPAATDNIAVTGYRLERQSSGSTTFTQIATPTGTTYSDAGLSAGATYTYRVRAVDAAGNLGAYSPLASATTLTNATGLVAAYSFNEGTGTSVADASGTGNVGTATNTTWSTSGKNAGALAFNGTSSQVTIPDSVSLHLTTGMTLEAWVRPTTVTSAWRDVIFKDNDIYFLEATSTTSSRPAGGAKVGTSTLSTVGTTALAVNTWTHLALTYDGANLRLYVNGAQVSSAARTGSISTSTNALQIGGDSTYGQRFAGLIDDVRIYNTALTAGQIQTDMNTPVGAAADTQAPTAPTSLSATAASTSQINLSWTAATDNVAVTGYRVERQDPGSTTFTQIATPTGTTYSDTGLTAGATYSYRVRAVDAAGNLGNYSPVASATTLSNNPAAVGQWSSVMDWPLVAINMVQLDNGKILMWSGQDCIGGESATVWDPATNTFTPVPLVNPDGSDRDIFCSGMTLLADGRVLDAGGHECQVVTYLGSAITTLFDPTTNQWTIAPDMQYRRWYPTVITMADGRAIVIGGGDRDYTPASYIPIPEVFDPQTNTWTTLTNARQTIPNYAFVFALPDGRILAAGSDEALMATYALNVATQTWSVVDPRILDAGSALMYLPGKIMKAGSSYIAGDQTVEKGIPSKATTYVLDMTQPSPAWQQTASMANARTHLNLTVLPDGNVLATGGTTDISGEFPQYGVLPAEMWSPATQTWTTMSSMQVPRMYHSTALLLPDGRILSAGGGRTGDSVSYDYLNAEIYSPPYLFKGTRPTIAAAPSTLHYNSSFFVQTPDAASIASVSLIRNGSVTHSVNMDQRFVPLSFTQTAGGLNVQAPADANLAPPGYYMLFIVNSNGVPSIAPFVRLPAGYEDSQAPTAPTNLTATGGIGAAALSWSPATDNTAVVHYNVYRSTAPNFTPTSANRIAQPTTTSYTDTGLIGGTYYYLVDAEDATGNIGPASAQAIATVTTDSVLPSVAITSPVNGATVSQTVTINADASDNVAIAGVQFLLDGNNLGAEDTSAPYSYSWNSTTVTNGTHTLSARARDTGGNINVSDSITITVSNALPSGLVLALGFNEGTGTTVSDQSGNNNNGTLSGATWATAGKFGKALLFNGTSALVTIPDRPSLDLTTGMTLEAWVNPSATVGAWRDIIYKSNDIYYLEGSSPQASAPAMGGTFSANPIYGTGALPANTWTHVAATYDGATMRLFVNGTQVASRAQTGAIKTSTAAVSIGGDSLYGQYFAGLIDEVRIYNRALTATEIQTDMNLPVGNPLQLAGSAVTSSAKAAPLAAAKIQPLVNEAIARWRSALGNTLAIQNLNQVRISVMDLPGTTLSLASSTIIYLDKDAAGHGWFLDPTPRTDSEFAPGHVAAAAKNKVDLLSVLVHEFGHILGLDDVHGADPYAAANVMAEFIPLGVRRTPLADPSSASASALHAASVAPSAHEQVVDALLAQLDQTAYRKAKRFR